MTHAKVPNSQCLACGAPHLWVVVLVGAVAYALSLWGCFAREQRMLGVC